MITPTTNPMIIGIRPYVCDMADYNAKTSTYLYTRKKDFSLQLTDADNAHTVNNSNGNGYYFMYDFWMRSAVPCSVMLSSERKEIEYGGKLGQGTFAIGLLENKETASFDIDNGYDKSIRIGFLVQMYDIEGYPYGNSKFYIYEPNCDSHIDGRGYYIATPSYNGRPSLCDESRLFKQTTPSSSGLEPLSFGVFDKDPILCNLTPDMMAKIIMYVWVEAMDIDTDCLCQLKSLEFIKTKLNISIQFTSLVESTGIVRD